MKVQVQPLYEINQAAISLLVKGIGVVPTVRFLNQFTTGFGNYTEERGALYKDMSLNDLVQDIKKSRVTR